MKKFTTLICVLLLCASTTNLFAQKEILQSDTAKNGSVTYQRYDTLINRKPLSQAQSLLKSVLQMSNDDSLGLENIIAEKGRTHYLYQQYYKGFKVLYATYAVHAVNNVIEKVNGFFFRVGTPSVNVTVSEQTAGANALSFVNAKKYGWEDSFTQSLYRRQQKDSAATLYPKGRLVIYYDDSITHTYRLVYQFLVYAVQPLIDCNVYVDAISGNVIQKENLIKDANTPGTAATLYSGAQNIVMDSYNVPVEYRLQETRTGTHGTAQIQTLNMQNGGNYGAAVDFNNATVNWNNPDGSLDVHWGTEQVFDYWNNVRQRNSYDNAGGSLFGYVHANLVAMGYPDNDNAFWSPTLQTMTYGDGTFHFHQVTSLDVIAHEIGHGVCQHTANLQGTTNNPEPQSLNEGLSDVWGAIIENWAAPAKQTWEIGEDIMADGFPCLRSLQDPRNGGDPLLNPTGGNPDTYQGQFWYNANNVVDNNTLSIFAHTNSTVLSHWFYLLSVGGNGWNNGQTSNAPAGNGYRWNVNGIGITVAASIVWEAESIQMYNQPSTNYAAARNDMISAAQDLYGIGSCEEIAVTDAWYAVGVGAAYSGNAGMAINGDNIVCNTSGLYTINNLPNGSSVTWTASPSYTVTINSPNSPQTTLTKTANGTITLTAAISNICGNNTVYITKQVQVGLNTPSFVVNALDYCQGSHFSALATSNNPGQTISSYNWFLDGSPQSYTGFKLTGTFPSNNNYIELSVSSANCGTSDMYYLPGLDCSGGFDFTIMPNPASNTVTITTANTAATDTTTTLASRNSVVSKTTVPAAKAIIRQVKIVDVGGRLMKQMDYSTPQQQVIIDVTTLNPGIYFVSISGGKSISSKKLLIQR